ncbi:hypothetical protein E2562_028768 [Oryza meyeriana var. granulata]|uniref:Retrotransposon gag domain-containing protein n=1 Tax=Oryza meyeriana var. granulata TaxID=110450 RepID=A0A6G1FDA1_9ORYZ|nr:hypothetical protein E2562_028768 [Oryza meyeriana var. granulata]
MDLIHTREEDKVRFATNQLEGLAGDWWDTYKASREDGIGEPDWKEFVAVFHEIYVPAAIMKMKRDEFISLSQGGLSVQEYLNKFTQLARYALYDLPDEEEKVNKFLSGLNDSLRGPLIIHDHASFQSMIDKALRVEADNRIMESNEKQKFVALKNKLQDGSRFKGTPG